MARIDQKCRKQQTIKDVLLINININLLILVLLIHSIILVKSWYRIGVMSVMLRGAHTFVMSSVAHRERQ